MNTLPYESENKCSVVHILQSVTKIMGKTAIWTVLCFSPLPPLNNVGKQ